MTTIILAEATNHPARPEKRGYHAVFRRDEVTRCPGCGRSHWYVGRISAECGFCGTAVMLAEGGTVGAGLVRVTAFEVAA